MDIVYCQLKTYSYRKQFYVFLAIVCLHAYACTEISGQHRYQFDEREARSVNKVLVSIFDYCCPISDGLTHLRKIKGVFYGCLPVLNRNKNKTSCSEVNLQKSIVTKLISDVETIIVYILCQIDDKR